MKTLLLIIDPKTLPPDIRGEQREIPKYSRLVGKDEFVNKHDYNLNIRRYDEKGT